MVENVLCLLGYSLGVENADDSGQTSVFDAVNQVVDQVPDAPEIQNIVKFIRETKLGIISKL